MEEKLNLVEILKDVPKGTKLWSPICGECIFDNIDMKSVFAIRCLAVSNYTNEPSSVYFTSDGRYRTDFDDSKCVLFPSEYNHDWSTFKVPKKHKEFKPFQKVLRIDDNNLTDRVWSTDFYSHYDETINKHFLVSGFIKNDDEIIPYEGNENKLGKIVEK